MGHFRDGRTGGAEEIIGAGGGSIGAGFGANIRTTVGVRDGGIVDDVQIIPSISASAA